MSVNWGKHGPPEWLLLLDAFAGCGVGAFRVADVPKCLEELGTRTYTFDLAHAPTENNYPHSLIRAFDDRGTHLVDDSAIPPAIHLRWRNRLRQCIRLRISPPE